jgi:hypothetical protein
MVSLLTEMPRTAPGPERSRLGFAATVSEEFAFLHGLGFHLMELTDTLVRYETDRRLVRVFHGRGSYELGVEIGRWIEVDGVRSEQVFPLPDVIVRERDLADVGYGGTSATTVELVRKFVVRLAGWTRQFALPLLTDGDEIFAELSASNAAKGAAEREQQRASQLRVRANDAWRQRSFGTVIACYTEIDTKLPTVELSGVERGRLKYSRKALKAP